MKNVGNTTFFILFSSTLSKLIISCTSREKWKSGWDSRLRRQLLRQCIFQRLIQFFVTLGDPVVVTRRVKIDTTPVSQTTKTTHVVRHTSTPAEVVTKTITIEGDGEPLTAEELAEIMNMSGAETTVCVYKRS